jgi:hypothetical protein
VVTLQGSVAAKQSKNCIARKLLQGSQKQEAGSRADGTAHGTSIAEACMTHALLT